MDRWGVPESMFGPVPEDVYGLVGRITMVSALLEESLHSLYCVLARLPQETAIGESGTEQIRQLRLRLDPVPLERRGEAAALLDDAHTALQLRHEVAHSIWPHSGPGPVQGWRGKRGKQSTASPGKLVWTSISTDDFPEILGALVDVQHRCRILLPWLGAR